MFKLFSKSKSDTYFVCPASGDLIPITEVKDEMFSQKMIGDGFAVKPANGDVFSPVSGKVVTVFPTKHAIGLMTDQGDEIIIHIGIDTVSLEGNGLEVYVSEGDLVKKGQRLAKVDLGYLKEQEKDDVVIVIVTSMNNIDRIDITQNGIVKACEPVGIAIHKN